MLGHLDFVRFSFFIDVMLLGGPYNRDNQINHPILPKYTSTGGEVELVKVRCLS